MSVSNMTETLPAVSGLGAMLRGYSVELNPGQSKVLDAAMERLEPGTEVFLTWIPGENPMDTVAPAARLRHAGLLPVPHVGARHIESTAQLEQFAARLAGEAGVERILVIGGDRAQAAGPYESSHAIMQTGIFQKAGITRMAIGGFPEGNPYVSPSVEEAAFAAKLEFGKKNGLQLSIVTQFCFESKPILEWLKRVRAAGVEVPIRIGLAGPAGLMTLARYAVRCGIGNSLHVLTENPAFAKLLGEKGPEPIILELAARGAASLGIAGLHFYVFGGFNKTMDWIASSR
ncbi:MAG TPA: methylenetetrahydrofolate reductase [Terriglobales bacterium]